MVKKNTLRGIVLLLFLCNMFIFSYAVNNNDTNNTNTILDNNKEKEFSIMLGNITYNETVIIENVDNKAWLQNYIKDLGYDCVYTQTDTNKSFTVVFDVEQGKISNLSKEKLCDREVFIEESLFEDLQRDGFNESGIRTYLQKTDMSLMMYFNVLRVIIFN